MPTLTPKQAAQRMRDFRRRFKGNVIAAERVTAVRAYAEAVRSTSGTHSAAELSRAGHPYARRAPNSAYDPATVNVRSGLLRRSWRVKGPRIVGNDLRLTISNRARHSGFLFGTRLMVARPIWVRIAHAANNGRKMRLRDAFRRAWRG